MVVTSIRQEGNLKPQLRVEELRVGQAEIPSQVERWSLRAGSLYIRGVNLRCLTAPLATLLEA